MNSAWVVLVIVAIVVLLAIAFAASRRRSRPRFEVRRLAPEQAAAYQGRIGELEAMFVSQPREAVAAAKLMVDDMLIRMGYPVRLNDEERVRDISSVDSTQGERYRLGAGLKSDATTEQLRRALQAYIEMARSMLAESAGGSEEPSGRRQLAG